MNALINEIIDSTYKKLDAVKNDASLIEKYSTEPDNELDEIYQSDSTYQFIQENKKEGGSMI